jgi:fructose-bisphosphate aldolase, class I
MDEEQAARVRDGLGFFAALDQSGGSTPKTLTEYGIPESAYSSEAEMFDLVHRMRSRVISSPCFTGATILAAILFEQTMDREIDGVPTAELLWQHKHVVPFLKVDSGLADQVGGVQLMKPIDSLDELLDRARSHRVFGTKMRSVVHDADRDGIDAVVDQQLEYADRIARAGLVPILEPEVSIESHTKAEAETLLHEALADRIGRWPHDLPVMLKLTIPTTVDLYADLAEEPRVLRVLALSGGYGRDEACARLRRNRSMIASFSRALLEGLRADQPDEEFDRVLEHSVAEIYAASVHESAL